MSPKHCRALELRIPRPKPIFQNIRFGPVCPPATYAAASLVNYVLIRILQQGTFRQTGSNRISGDNLVGVAQAVTSCLARGYVGPTKIRSESGLVRSVVYSWRDWTAAVGDGQERAGRHRRTGYRDYCHSTASRRTSCGPARRAGRGRTARLLAAPRLPARRRRTHAAARAARRACALAPSGRRGLD